MPRIPGRMMSIEFTGRKATKPICYHWGVLKARLLALEKGCVLYSGSLCKFFVHPTTSAPSDDFSNS